MSLYLKALGGLGEPPLRRCTACTMSQLSRTRHTLWDYGTGGGLLICDACQVTKPLATPDRGAASSVWVLGPSHACRERPRGRKDPVGGTHMDAGDVHMDAGGVHMGVGNVHVGVGNVHRIGVL